jgi:hypothetical protein
MDVQDFIDVYNGKKPPGNLEWEKNTVRSRRDERAEADNPRRRESRERQSSRFHHTEYEINQLEINRFLAIAGGDKGLSNPRNREFMLRLRQKAYSIGDSDMIDAIRGAFPIDDEKHPLYEKPVDPDVLLYEIVCLASYPPTDHYRAESRTKHAVKKRYPTLL